MFQNKIKNGKYRCLEDLEDDFMLMCKNAQTYNVEGSEIFEHSIVLGSIFTDIKEKFQRQFEDSIAQGSAGGAMAAGAGPPGGYDGMDNLSDSDYGEFLKIFDTICALAGRTTQNNNIRVQFLNKVTRVVSIIWGVF